MDSWLNELNWKTKTAFLKSHRGCVVLFTDETRSCLMAGDGCGVELESNMQSDVFNQLQPMVFGVSWCGRGGISLTRKTPLVQIAGNLTGQHYVDLCMYG